MTFQSLTRPLMSFPHNFLIVIVWYEYTWKQQQPARQDISQRVEIFYAPKKEADRCFLAFLVWWISCIKASKQISAILAGSDKHEDHGLARWCSIQWKLVCIQMEGECNSWSIHDDRVVVSCSLVNERIAIAQRRDVNQHQKGRTADKRDSSIITAEPPMRTKMAPAETSK